MRRIMILTVLLAIMISSSVQALDWAISFVVWKGNVYEVKRDQVIDENEIGERIGRVKTQPNDRTGRYFGDASNAYPKGTPYYEIKEIPTSIAIAVKDGKQWVKAVYIHKAPFHILNFFYHSYFQFAALIMVDLLIVYQRLKSKHILR